MRPAQAALAAALREHAIREGEFTLSSGRRSRWYLDGRRATFRGDCIEIVGDAVVEALGSAGVGRFDAVGGLAIGAIPVALAVALVTGTSAFAVRKETKDHGVAGRIAGPLEPTGRVVVVEDTVTTGASLLTAIDVVTEHGNEVIAATCLLDRGGELADALSGRGVRYVPVLTAPELGYEYGS